MRRSLLWLLGMTPVLAFAGPETPVQWSPGGRWVAYGVEAIVPVRVPPAGWLMGNSQATARAARNEPLAERATRYRIYACDSESHEAVLLEDSRFPVMTPQWSPDGHALAFGRLLIDGADSSSFQVVIQE